MNKITFRQNNESGLASIIVVMTLIIILSLTVLGFSRIMDRELRQALDRELSVQAQYAAESGVNAARAYILDQGPAAVSTGANCMDYGSVNKGLDFFVKSISESFTNPDNYAGTPTDNLVKYTCVLLNPEPSDLIYEIPAGESRVFKMVMPNGRSLNNLIFSWRNSEYCLGTDTNCTPQALGNPFELPQESNVPPQKHGLLRVAIYPIPQQNVNNTILNASARTYFLYPNQVAARGQWGTINYNSGTGKFVEGKCNINNETGTDYLPYKQGTGRYCNAEVSNLPNYNVYYVRLTAIYQSLKISVQGTDNANNFVHIQGAQVKVDVTGEGNDVLRRIQARVPFNPERDLPAFALQSIEELCKRLRLPAIGPNVFGDAEQDSSVQGDPACAP